MSLRLVLFDVDGVLLDSLTPHLKICEDKNKEYRLGLKIPSTVEFKAMVRAGARISPMKDFFIAVGFPEEFADKANEQYQQVFLKSYAPRPFPGVYETLTALKNDRLELGIVTSNVRTNVLGALGKSVPLFRSDCIFSKEDLRGSSKSQALERATLKAQIHPAQTIYVGDQPADWQAAKAAGVHFLGVTYGWGISEEDTDFPVVTDVAGIHGYIHDRNLQQLDTKSGSLGAIVTR